MHEIIAAADATNHAIPTKEEMSQALTKFVQCRLICEEKGHYTIASEYLASIETAFS